MIAIYGFFLSYYSCFVCELLLSFFLVLVVFYQFNNEGEQVFFSLFSDQLSELQIRYNNELVKNLYFKWLEHSLFFLIFLLILTNMTCRKFSNDEKEQRKCSQIKKKLNLEGRKIWVCKIYKGIEFKKTGKAAKVDKA